MKRFAIDVYGVWVIVCSSREEVARAMRQLGSPIEEHQGRGAGVSAEILNNGCAYHILGVFDGDIRTLGHEASHVVDMILRRKGIEDPVDTEVRAYLLGHVVGESAARLTGMKWPRRRKS